MSNKNKKRLLIGVCSFSLIAIIGIIYAAFTGNLNINGTGINRKSKFDIYFNNVSDFQVTGSATVTDPNPTVRNHTTVIEDYEATLISPGDSVYFTFNIVNDGDYDATLTDLVIGPVECSVNGNESDTSAQKVCNNIEYTMKYTNSNSNVSINDTLKSKETKEVKVTLTYNSNISASDLPTDNVTISNLGIDMVYTASSEAKTNPDGTTPYNSYSIGTEVTVLNEKYNVVGIGDDYVTLLKQEPLTYEEMTENNYGQGYINRYTFYSVGQVYNFNDYGAIAYYSSPTCGYNGSSWIYDGCTTSYDVSDIKHVVDDWANAKFTNGEIKTVDGYGARLATKEELQPIGWPNCKSLLCPKEDSTPNWIFTPGYYLTMTPVDSSSTLVWGVDFSGKMGNINVYYCNIDVRPVINVYKSAIEK